MDVLVDSANTCAHSVPATLKLESNVTLSFNSWIFVVQQ